MEHRVLKVLPADVQSRLRSDVAITSVAQCVEELVLNSLDAGAVCIAIRLDLTTFTVQVVDNGTGISQDDLKLIGERYSTSKCQKLADLDNLEYFGFRGEALASLRDISTALEIHSRSRQSSMTYCKLFNHGKPVAVADSKYPRPCPGTTITVHNLFYNLPVRQKNIFPTLELERTRYRIEGISLINPSISFSLRNDATGHILLQTQKSNSILTAFMYLFGGNLSKHLKPVAIDKEPFHIEGYIGKDGYNKKLLQFVYVNNRLVLKTQVHKIVNKTMTNCIHFRRKVTKDVKSSTSGTSPRCMEKHPMFVINIKCPLNIYDITFDPKKTLVEFKDWETLTSAVETMVTDFLKSENLWYCTESDLIKTTDSSSPLEPTTEQIDALKKIQEETELQVSNEPEISTLNTSNSLFSKTVFRKPPGVQETKTPSPPMIEVTTPVQGKEKDDETSPPKSSDSQEAVKEFAKRLHINFNPKRSDFASDDEVPMEEHIKKVNQVEAIASWSDTSSVSSEDTLQEDPLLPNIANKTLLLPPPQTSHDPNPSFISLPSDTECISTMDTLRCKEVFNGGKNLTAAQKISLRLKERGRISLLEKEASSKVSRVLQKFRKVSRQKVVEIVTLKHNELCGNVAVLESNIHKEAGDAPEAKADEPDLPDVLALNINNSNLNTKYKSDTRDQHLDRKRTNLNGGNAPIPNQSKKSKFMTSESFVMTPRTALVEVLPLLQRAQRHTEKIQNATNHEKPSSLRNEQSPKNNGSVVDAFLDRTFKRPHPIDQSRRYHSSKFSSFARPGGGHGCSNTLSTSQSQKMADVDDTEEHSGKFIDSSQGFSIRITPSSSFKEADQSGIFNTSPKQFQESQGFSLSISSPDFDSSRLVACPNKHLYSKTPVTADQTFPPTLAFEYSTDDSEKTSQLSPSSSLSDKPSGILLTPFQQHSSTDHQMNISTQLDSEQMALPPSSDDKISDILQMKQCSSSCSDPQLATSTEMATEQSVLTGQLLDSNDTAVTSSQMLSTMEDILMPGNNSTIVESQTSDPGIVPRTPCLSLTNKNSEMCVDSPTHKSSVAKPFESGSVKDNSFQCGQKYNSNTDEKPYTDSYSFTDLLSDNSQTAFEISASCAAHFNSDNDPTGSEICGSNITMQKDQPEMQNQESNRIMDKDHLEMDTQGKNMTKDKDHVEMETLESNRTMDRDQFQNEDQHEQKIPEEEKEVKDCATESCNGDTTDIWIEMTDKNSGKVIHVNQLTGNTVYEKEWMVLQQTFNKPGFSNSENILCSKKTSSNISTLCTNDTNNLYDMLLNHLDTNQEEQTIKWRNETNINSNTGNSIDDMFNQWQNPVHGKPNQCGINTEVSHSSRSAVTSYQSLNQITFTKDMLSCMQVLGQVDSKFIACLISSTTQSQNKVPDLLVMLDQHAAHERVRLEQYISEIFGEEVDGEVSDKVKQSEITPPLSLTLQQEDIRVMISFKHEFSRIGIKFTGVEENRNEIKLNSIPACIVEREANELKRGKNSIATQFVEELITEHVEYLKNTSGSRRRLPLALHRILATKACRGAIKFNDILSPAQCKELITALSKCDLPFQCAHGRPSIIPLFKLDRKLFQQTQVKPQLDKLRKGIPKQE